MGTPLKDAIGMLAAKLYSEHGKGGPWKESMFTVESPLFHVTCLVPKDERHNDDPPWNITFREVNDPSITSYPLWTIPESELLSWAKNHILYTTTAYEVTTEVIIKHIQGKSPDSCDVEGYLEVQVMGGHDLWSIDESGHICNVEEQ